MVTKPNAVLILNPADGDQGFLLPQLTSTQRLAISPTSPNDDGLVVYDITEQAFYYWNTNAWVKGLGDGNNQTITYDPATQTLSLSGGSSVALGALKELPVQTGQAGKFLTTDGTTVSWITVAALGDITEVIAGSGLTGGSASGPATLAVNVNPASLAINGSNQVELANDAVTTAKLANNSVTDAKILSVAPGKLSAGGASSGQILKWNGSSWTPQPDNAGSGTVTQVIAGTGLSGGTITSTGTIALTNTGVTASSYGSGTQIPILTIDAQGRITNASSVTVSGASPTGSAGGDLSGTYPNPTIVNNAITNSKINADAVTSAKIADGTIQTLDIANEAITSAKIADGAIATLDLQASSVTDAKIAAGVSLTKLSSAGASTGQVIKWNGSAWVPQNESAAVTSITASGGLDGGTITSTGSISIADNGVTSAKILDATISTADIADNSVTTNKLVSTGVVASTYGSASQVPVIQVDTKGRISSVTNTTISGIAPGGAAGGDLTGTYPNPTIAANAVGGNEITDGSISGVDLADASVSNIKLADASVNSIKIQDATIVNADISNTAAVGVGKLAAGTNGQVLTTVAGTTAWAAAPTATGTASGDLSGSYPSPTVARLQGRNVSSSAPLTGDLLSWTGTAWTPARPTVDNLTITGSGAPGSPFGVKPGTANQVLITNSSTNAVWANQSSLAANLTASGDVTGNLTTTVVARLQGNAVDNAALNGSDNGKALIWNGTEWTATTVTGITPTTSYYSIDPADFQAIRNAGKKDEDNIIIFEENSEFVTILKRNDAKNIIAPIQVPDGAIITQVTAFYMDDAVGSINIKIFRKNLASGTKTQIGTITSSNNSSAIISQSATLNETVSNNLHTYRIEIELNPDTDINSFNDATHRIYGFRVTYTK